MRFCFRGSSVFLLALAFSGILEHQHSVRASASAISSSHPDSPSESPVTRSLRRRRADLLRLSATSRRSTLLSPRLVRAQRLFLTTRQLETEQQQSQNGPREQRQAEQQQQQPVRVPPTTRERARLPESVIRRPTARSGDPAAVPSLPADLRRVRLVARRRLEPRTTTTTSDPGTELQTLTATESSNEVNFGPDTEKPLILPQFLVPRTFINKLFGGGEPGVHFPDLTILPRSLSFSCQGRIAGFYADPQHGCQVYHNCLPDGRIYSHMCGVGTVFNQKAHVCDHWFNYDCDDAEKDYVSNKALHDENGNFLF